MGLQSLLKKGAEIYRKRQEEAIQRNARELEKVNKQIQLEKEKVKLTEAKKELERLKEKNRSKSFGGLKIGL